MALCSSQMLGTECRWQVLQWLGQTFLYMAFPVILPKSLPNYTVPLLVFGVKHPGQLMCRFNRRKQPEQPPLTKGRGGVSCSSRSGEATQPDYQVLPEPSNLSPLRKRRGPKPGISTPTNLQPLLKEWHCSL